MSKVSEIVQGLLQNKKYPYSYRKRIQNGLQNYRDQQLASGNSFNNDTEISEELLNLFNDKNNRTIRDYTAKPKSDIDDLSHLYEGNDEAFYDILHKKESRLDKEADKFLQENDPDFFNSLQEKDWGDERVDELNDYMDFLNKYDDNGLTPEQLSKKKELSDIYAGELFDYAQEGQRQGSDIVDRTQDVADINDLRKKVISLMHKDDPNRPQTYNELVGILKERNYPQGRNRYKQVGDWLDRSEKAMRSKAGLREGHGGYHGSEQDFNRMNALDKEYDANIDVETGNITPRPPLIKYSKKIDPELIEDFMTIFQDKKVGEKILDTYKNSKHSGSEIESELVRLLEFID